MKKSVNKALTYSMLLFALIGAQKTIAEPKIIGEEAGTIETDSYKRQYNSLIEKTQTRDYRLAYKNPQTTESKELSWSTLLPIKSEKMKPGIFKSIKAPGKKASQKPYCIIGYDKYSFEWIRQVKDLLIKENAVCFIVSVENEKQLKKLREAITPVPWQLLHGDELATRLGISIYPALVSKLGIEQ